MGALLHQANNEPPCGTCQLAERARTILAEKPLPCPTPERQTAVERDIGELIRVLAIAMDMGGTRR